MSSDMHVGSHERLIRSLVSELVPVRRLAKPAWRALIWCAAVAAIAIVFSFIFDVPAMVHRLSAAPDMWLAALGSMLTALLAAYAAFELSVPGRHSAWALLPLPALVLWIVASGLGCFRAWAIPEVHNASFSEARDCLVYILLISTPLTALLMMMLRRAYPLRPELTAVIAGLASAAAAATLLNFFHPFDATVTDLGSHVIAVLLVIAANRIFGGRILQAA